MIAPRLLLLHNHAGRGGTIPAVFLRPDCSGPLLRDSAFVSLQDADPGKDYERKERRHALEKVLAQAPAGGAAQASAL